MEYLVSSTAILLCTMGSLAQPYPRQAGYYAPAPVGQDGRVVDTPEVAQAKAAHLAAFSRLNTHPTVAPSVYYQGAPNNNYQQAAANPIPKPAKTYDPQGAFSNPGFFTSRIQHGPYGYDGPPAPLAQDGRVIDTPEVAQAKAAHFAAFSQAAARAYNAPGAYNPPAPLAHNPHPHPPPPPPPATYNHNNNHHNNNNNHDYKVNDNSNDEDYNDYSSGPYSDDDDDEDSSGSEEGYETRQSPEYQEPPAPLAQNDHVVNTLDVNEAEAAHLSESSEIERTSNEHRDTYPARSSYYDDY